MLPLARMGCLTGPAGNSRTGVSFQGSRRSPVVAPLRGLIMRKLTRPSGPNYVWIMR